MSAPERVWVVTSDSRRPGSMFATTDRTSAQRVADEESACAGSGSDVVITEYIPAKLALYHRELCAALQLDPARATPEDVIGLVAALTARLEIMTEKRGRCARTARMWRSRFRDAVSFSEKLGAIAEQFGKTTEGVMDRLRVAVEQRDAAFKQADQFRELAEKAIAGGPGGIVVVPGRRES